MNPSLLEYITEDRLSQHQKLTQTVACSKRQRGWGAYKKQHGIFIKLVFLWFDSSYALVDDIFAACVAKVV